MLLGFLLQVINLQVINFLVKSRISAILKLIMASKLQSLSLDIGPEQIKLFNLKKAKDGIVLQGLEITPLPQSHTQLAREFEFPRLLKETYKKLECSHKGISCLSPGRGILTVHMTLPPTNRFKLSQIVKYEVQQQIPLSDDQAVYDYQLLRTSKAEGHELVVAISRKDQIEERINLIQSAGLKVSTISASPIALFNVYLYNYTPDSELSAIVNIGADQTDIVIQKEGQLHYARTIPTGGDIITYDLQRKLKIDMQEAKRIKEQEATLYPGEEGSTDERLIIIQKTLIIGLNQILSELNASFKFFFKKHTQLKDRQIKKIYLSGGTSLLKGIDRFMSEQLDAPVELLNPLSKIKIAPGRGEQRIRNIASSLAIGIGLGLQDLDLAPIKINLLPQRMKEKREKKVNLKYVFVSIIIGISLMLTPLIQTGLGYLYAKKTLENVEARIAKFEDYLPEVAALRKENKKIKERTDILKKISLHNRVWLDNLSALTALTPEKIYFDTLLVKLTKDETIDYFILKGDSPDYGTIEKLNTDLEKSRDFSQIKVIKVDDGIARLPGGKYSFIDRGLTFMAYIMPRSASIHAETKKQASYDTKNR